MMKMFKIGLLLWLLFTSYTQAFADISSDLHPSYIYDCQEKGRSLHYPENTKIELCCSTSYQSCVTNNTLLTIRKEDGASFWDDWTLTHGNGSIVKLTIPSSRVGDRGGYRCDCNGIKVFYRKVNIIGKVDAPKILTVTSKIRQILSVVFDPGKADPNMIVDNFTVSMRDRDKVDVLCKNETISCTRRKCICNDQRNSTDFVFNWNVTITVTKQRSVVTVEGSKTLNLIEHIRPGPVGYLNVETIRPREASLLVCAPPGASYVISEMNHSGFPLSVSVMMIKTQGFEEKRKFSINFRHWRRACLEIPLLRLTPFTRYNLTVTSAGGGGIGGFKKYTFVSGETAPLTSPKTTFYWITPDRSEMGYNNSLNCVYEDSKINNFYALNINWKPILHDEKGGDGVYYEIAVLDRIGNLLCRRNVTQPYVILRKVPDTDVSVEIYAGNKLHGRSGNYSFLEVRRESDDIDIIQAESHVEIDNDKAQVFIQNSQSVFKVFAVYSCLGYQDTELPSLVVCKDDLQLVSEGTRVDRVRYLTQAVVNLRRRPLRLLNTTTEYRQEEFVFYRNSKFNTPLPRKSFTVSVSSSERTSSQFIDDRDEISQQGKVHRKFMYSVVRDGKEGSRLYPFKCYYDSKFESVDLKFIQDRSENEVSLEWKQQCDLNFPTQFLVATYRVYTSKDKYCQPETATSYTDLNNKIVHPTKFQMPWENVYACVKSLKSPLETTTRVAPYYVEEYAVNGGAPYWIIVLAVFIPILVIGIPSVIYCRRIVKAREEKAIPNMLLCPWPVEIETPSPQNTNDDGDSGLVSSTNDYSVLSDKRDKIELEFINEGEESGIDSSGSSENSKKPLHPANNSLSPCGSGCSSAPEDSGAVSSAYGDSVLSDDEKYKNELEFVKEGDGSGIDSSGSSENETNSLSASGCCSTPSFSEQDRLNGDAEGEGDQEVSQGDKVKEVKDKLREQLLKMGLQPDDSS